MHGRSRRHRGSLYAQRWRKRRSTQRATEAPASETRTAIMPASVTTYCSLQRSVNAAGTFMQRPAAMRPTGCGEEYIQSEGAKMRKTPWLFFVALAAFLTAQPSYRISRTYSLGGDGSWDYVVPDPPNHRVFIARQNRVMVVDENDGKLLGEVTGINGAHGTAIAESSGHGFATSGNDQSVVMFDLKTYQTLGRIPSAEDTDAIVYDKPSNRVFTLN